ncbi:hypothetical protein [Microbacterium sp. Leaf203]|jgi:hypothetical protein|uniref:hypothetical protein n=1 Tax=Microbacterium sp. Leaf203 TaxID=1735677 RepID=UPI0006F843A9|nr:hypothetical protein [Microbacterium sp. Leaf203]KQM40237.1 hypothetical protein ASE56_07725 [Microbacterium sp. Leaf203]
MSEPSESGATAFQLTLRTTDTDVEPEVWRATIHSALADASVHKPRLAEAIVYRVHYANPRWTEQLGDAEADLTSIGSAFADRELISMLDESSLFTDNLCVIASVDVHDDVNGTALSHELVRSIARVFDGDSIALLGTRRCGADESTDPWLGHAHWAAIGFVDIPGTTSMILPVGSRS